MDLWIFLISVCVLVSQGVCQEQATIFELTDDNPMILWNPISSETIEVHADQGYQIQIDVALFHVDGEEDNAVTVKGITEDGELTDEMMFTYVVSGKPSYLYNNHKVQADYVGTNTSNLFVLEFTRVGEAMTTTTIIPTTTLEPMPTASPDEEATLTVYLYGRPAGLFSDREIKRLKEAIAKMGSEYCEVQNCPLNETITWKNVQIEMLKQCSVMWEDYDGCVLLTFALPIVKPEDQEKNPLWDGYQLNESHLKILWDAYGSKYMGMIGLSLYPVPDLNVIFKYRIILISLVIVVLIILVLFARHVAGRLHKKRRRLSDTMCIIERNSDRISEQSLPPHYLQELPSYFIRNHMANFSEYNMAFSEDDDKSMSQPAQMTISQPDQITISNDINDLEDAHA